ncbi:hypothetical protein [Bradyrhizobium sp. B120]|uniref:helix-turn-helix domain-containing protein n=1 Tax=Bradyrhizobium sp. B120 TaxID=3410088 RepID=UPI003B986705
MKAAGLPSREIARRVGAAPSTVRQAIRQSQAAGLTWPFPRAHGRGPGTPPVRQDRQWQPARVTAASPSPIVRPCTASSSASSDAVDPVMG